MDQRAACWGKLPVLAEDSSLLENRSLTTVPALDFPGWPDRAPWHLLDNLSRVCLMGFTCRVVVGMAVLSLDKT
jgi:hypothetical protein